MIGYASLARYTIASPANGNLGALVAFTPLVLIALIFAWRSPARLSALSLVLLACIGLWAMWPILEAHFGLVFWIEHVGMQLILFITFGRTLTAGQKSLCTRFAEAIHSPHSPTVKLTPQHEKYTRQVTLAWTVFFGLMALVSSVLFFTTTLATWSTFANFMTLPLIALMFIGEYWVRKQVLPNMQHARLLDAIRAYRMSSAPPR